MFYVNSKKYNCVVTVLAVATTLVVSNAGGLINLKEKSLDLTVPEQSSGIVKVLLSTGRYEQASKTHE